MAIDERKSKLRWCFHFHPDEIFWYKAKNLIRSNIDGNYQDFFSSPSPLDQLGLAFLLFPILMIPFWWGISQGVRLSFVSELPLINESYVKKTSALFEIWKETILSRNERPALFSLSFQSNEISFSSPSFHRALVVNDLHSANYWTVWRASALCVVVSPPPSPLICIYISEREIQHKIAV